LGKDFHGEEVFFTGEILFRHAAIVCHHFATLQSFSIVVTIAVVKPAAAN